MWVRGFPGSDAICVLVSVSGFGDSGLGFWEAEVGLSMQREFGKCVGM